VDSSAVGPTTELPLCALSLTTNSGIIACTAQNMNTLIGANVLLGLGAGIQYVQADAPIDELNYTDESVIAHVMD